RLGRLLALLVPEQLREFEVVPGVGLQRLVGRGAVERVLEARGGGAVRAHRPAAAQQARAAVVPRLRGSLRRARGIVEDAVVVLFRFAERAALEEDRGAVERDEPRVGGALLGRGVEL